MVFTQIAPPADLHYSSSYSTYVGMHSKSEMNVMTISIVCLFIIYYKCMPHSVDRASHTHSPLSNGSSENRMSDILAHADVIDPCLSNNICVECPLLSQTNEA